MQPYSCIRDTPAFLHSTLRLRRTFQETQPRRAFLAPFFINCSCWHIHASPRGPFETLTARPLLLYFSTFLLPHSFIFLLIEQSRSLGRGCAFSISLSLFLSRFLRSEGSSIFVFIPFVRYARRPQILDSVSLGARRCA